jgi:hypothetical protein
MATNINTILGWFTTGKKPTQTQFSDSWQSFWHKNEAIPQSSITNLTSTLNKKVEKSEFEAHKADEAAHAAMFEAKEDKTQKGVEGGYAPLNESAKIPSQYLDIKVPTLQQVTEAGDTTNGYIMLTEEKGSRYGRLGYDGFMQTNESEGTIGYLAHDNLSFSGNDGYYSYLQRNELMFGKGGYITRLVPTLIFGNDAIVSLPGKSGTVALLSDIATSSSTLQEITDVGNSTKTPIQVKDVTIGSWAGEKGDVKGIKILNSDDPYFESTITSNYISIFDNNSNENSSMSPNGFAIGNGINGVYGGLGAGYLRLNNSSIIGTLETTTGTFLKIPAHNTVHTNNPKIIPITINGQFADEYGNIDIAAGVGTPVSATQSGIVNNTTLQELGGTDKLINGIRVGQGAGTGVSNTTLGTNVLSVNTTGSNNTGVGFGVLEFNTKGESNTGLGGSALHANTTGSYNDAFGGSALGNNTTGEANTAVGGYALSENLTSSYNVAIGTNALSTMKSGLGQSTAIGSFCMSDATSTDKNAAIGTYALRYNTSGYSNTAIGHTALGLNTSGHSNNAVGNYSLGAVSTGVANVGVGKFAGRYITTGSSNIYIGAEGVANDATANGIINIGNRITVKGTKVSLIGTINIGTTPVFTDNSTALAGGLTAGDVYRATSGILMIAY